MSRAQVRTAVVNYLVANSTIATEAFVLANNPVSLPVTISTGSNDTFVFTGSGGLGTPETFTMQAGTFTTLASLESVVTTAIGSVSSEQFGAHCVVMDNGTNLIFVMNGVSGAADNGNKISAGNGGAALLGFTTNPNLFAGGVSGAGTIPFVAKVFGFPPKFTPEGELYPSDDPGVQSGCAIYVYIGHNREKRIAMGGAHNGNKWVNYEVTLHCLFFSQKPLSQDAGVDNESMLDGLITAIRADRNLGAPGIIFQAGEGGEAGGEDIDVTSFYPQNTRGQLSTTLTISTVRIQVAQVLNT